MRFCVESNGCYAKVKALYEKILVVDDDPNVSTVFGEIAELIGYRSVEKAANGLEALGKYEVSKPDLVLWMDTGHVGKSGGLILMQR